MKKEGVHMGSEDSALSSGKEGATRRRGGRCELSGFRQLLAC